VQRNAGDLVGCFDAFNKAAGVEAVKEVGAVAGGDAEDAAAAVAFGREVLSSQLPTMPSRSYSLMGERERRSHQRIFLSSEAVTRMLRSVPRRWT
jgi:hypothetical protein